MLFSPFWPTKISATPDGAGPVAHDVIHVDAVGDEAGHRLVAEHVLADPGDEGHRAPGARRADRLVGPLAARGGDELPAQDGFARLGDAVHLDDHVGVGAADDEDGVLGHKRWSNGDSLRQ